MGRNRQALWRESTSRRAAVLIDGASYFEALRAAMLRAEHCIFIIGWDIHSETRLVGATCKAHDGFPDKLGDFLHALLDAKPDLRIYILIWNASVLYAGEREWFALERFAAHHRDRLFFCLDNSLPLGSSQHQKIVTVDDAIAFSGGCDLTIRRWDNCDHDPENCERVDPAGVAYAPYHDIQMAVDGDAARSLAELVRERWRQAGCEDVPLVKPVDDRWPAQFASQFTDARVGIARTEPAADDHGVVREVEQKFLDDIRKAKRAIYIENQFMSAEIVAHQLAEQMKRVRDLEVLLIAPKAHPTWLEAPMRNGRIEFMEIFERAGVAQRVALLYPRVQRGDLDVPVMVHSKVMIVDDVSLRVGSANLNNRSMGADTECDLVIDAYDTQTRAAIERVRNDLFGHHCGVTAEDVAASLSKNPSILRAARTLSADGHSLAAVDDGIPDPKELSSIVKPIADPRGPLNLSAAATRTMSSLVKIAAALAFVTLLAVVWRYTPLKQYVDLDWLSQSLQSLQGNALAPLVIVLMFVAGGLVLFPVIVMIAATGAALGPWLGFTSAALGALASAALVYALGHLIGTGPLRALFGHRIDRMQKIVVRNGIFSVALIRMVPVAPFSLVNFAAGASGIRFWDFLIGTMIGMAPGLVAMTAFGAQLADILTEPTFRNLSILTITAVAWIGFSFLAQFVVTWLNRHA